MIAATAPAVRPAIARHLPTVPRSQHWSDTAVVSLVWRRGIVRCGMGRNGGNGNGHRNATRRTSRPPRSVTCKYLVTYTVSLSATAIRYIADISTVELLSVDGRPPIANGNDRDIMGRRNQDEHYRRITGELAAYGYGGLIAAGMMGRLVAAVTREHCRRYAEPTLRTGRTGRTGKT